MLDRTRTPWMKQHGLVGDRLQLSSAVASAVEARSGRYPGSYVDSTPAFVWPSVAFVDVD